MGKKRLLTTAGGAGDIQGIDGSLVKEEVLDCFWGLASTDFDTRIENAKKLKAFCAEEESKLEQPTVLQLRGEDGEHAKDEEAISCSKTTEYSLNRLFQGLSSTRKDARLGFSLGLSSLVELVASQNKNSQAWRRLLRYLRGCFAHKDGQDVIGHVFGIGSLVSSTCAVPDDCILDLVDDLVDLFFAKSFVRQACVKILADLLAYDKIKDPSIYFSSRKLQQLLTDCPRTAEIVTLSLGLWPYLTDSLLQACPVLPKSETKPDKSLVVNRPLELFSKYHLKASKSFFEAKHLQKILSYLHDSTGSLSHIHASWECMLRLLIPGYSSGDDSSVVCDIDETSIKNFWDILVEDKLFGSSSHEQKYLGFSIFAQILPCVRGDGLRILLTPKFLKTLANNVHKKNTYLHKASTSTVQLLVDYTSHLESSKRSEIVLLVKTSTGSLLSHYFKDDLYGIKEKESASVFLKQMETILRSSDETVASLSHTLSRVPGIVRTFQSSPVDCKELLFSLVDTYFTLQEKFSQEGTEGPEMSIKIMGTLINCFGIMGKSSAIDQAAKVEIEVLERIEGKMKQLKTDDLTTRSAVEFRHLILSYFGNKKLEHGDIKKLNAYLHIISLLELYGICNEQTFDDDLVADLKQVFSIAFNRVQNTADESTYWGDVLIDCVLTILSRNDHPYPSAPLRDAGEILFRNFAEATRRNGLKALLSVMTQGVQTEGSDIEEEEEPLEDQSHMSEMSLDDAQEGSDEDTSSGGYAMDTDLDFSEIPDATDEDMFKMDATLGALFLTSKKKKSTKQIREDLSNFKLRVVSCIETLIKRFPEGYLLLDLPDALLTALSSACNNEESQVLKERLASLIKNKLSKIKCEAFMKECEGIEIEEVVSQFRRTLYLASRSPMKLVSESACSAYIFLQRLVESSGKSDFIEISRASCTAAIDDYFTKKKCKLTKGFFPDLFRKVPTLSQHSLGALMEQSYSARNAYLQVEAFLMVGNILKNISREEATEIINVHKSIYETSMGHGQDLSKSAKKKDVRKVLAQLGTLCPTE